MISGDERGRLAAAADFLGIALSDAAIRRLLDYRDLIIKWNRVYNLTAVDKAAEILDRHLVDSLSIASLVQPGNVLDIGSGAGLPGIPLAIALPDQRFTLVDTSAKRTRFMTQSVIDLGLQNVSVVQTRIERFQPDTLFTNVASRAFSSLPDFVAAGARLLAEDGVLIAMKGQLHDAEISPLAADWRLVCRQLDYPGRNGERHAVILTRPAS
ncbi:MAG: 16S rRNA (guanine(527)-N(7))-methyltransferase RsmG [Gammaproteobacteria bacterium]|nr:16S rRNA (guanine(527)-N(7))-methyltransferase RsmG [Gammaproteobacteria bacterium]MCP5138220.1 16S rRNA (guanine(527)-N(7))-methyltransferase RsmG [Gammaproteobacteria bacterium]